MDFLLVLIELFSQVLQLRRYEQISVQYRRFRSNGGPVDQKFHVEGVAPPQLILLRKLG